MLDLFLLYKFIRQLATPFDEWDAYEHEIVDKNGKILRSRKSLSTRREKEAFTAYDLMVLNLKKLLEKIPGGRSRLGSYAAALYLLREWNHFTSDSLLNESTSDTEIAQSVEQLQQHLILVDESSIVQLESKVNEKMSNLDRLFEQRFGEEAPTNSAGSGAIAGIGVGPDGEPGLTVAARIKHIARNKKKKDKRKWDMESKTYKQD